MHVLSPFGSLMRVIQMGEAYISWFGLWHVPINDLHIYQDALRYALHTNDSRVLQDKSGV